MNRRTKRFIAFCLFIVLLGLSFLKDEFSPDYFNSISALFLYPGYHVSRFASLHTQSLFWFAALMYSLMFIIFPYLIMRFLFEEKKLAVSVLITLIVMCVIIYVLIFMNSEVLDRAIIPKLNRYFHSPIMLMFFVASFTILKRSKE